MKSTAAIHHDLNSYLQDVTRWENEILIVDGNVFKVFRNGIWEILKVYELRPSYNRQPLCNPDGTKVESEIVNKKPN